MSQPINFQSKEASHNVVINGLWDFYSQSMLPLETATTYANFSNSTFSEGELKSPPLVLLVGPYSAGKTTFIRHLVGKDYPGMRIGPEPTTDKFVAIMHGPQERVVPGNALTVSPGSPFGGCNNFGNGFLTRFEGSLVDSELLKRITLIDTPGVLSGKKQKDSRTYDFDAVLNWFAERSDMIILLLDPFKVDISDEMANVIACLQSNSDKVKVALNKSDMVSQQQLMRVYGALMWNLGKVINSPEVCRVYFGSFWEHPPKNKETEKLLTNEMKDLMQDLQLLPRERSVRVINDIVRRTRRLRVHCCLLDHLRNEMPALFGKDKRKAELLKDMPQVFEAVSRKYNLPLGDFPNCRLFCSIVADMDFTAFPALNGWRLKNGKILEEMEAGIAETIPKLLQSIPAMSASTCQNEVRGLSNPKNIMDQANNYNRIDDMSEEGGVFDTSYNFQTGSSFNEHTQDGVYGHI